MDEILLKTLDSYFIGLSNTGYRNYEETESILTVLILQEILEGELHSYIKEEDLLTIFDTIDSLLCTSCLLRQYFGCNSYKTSIAVYNDYTAKLYSIQEELQNIKNKVDSIINIQGWEYYLTKS